MTEENQILDLVERINQHYEDSRSLKTEVSRMRIRVIFMGQLPINEEYTEIKNKASVIALGVSSVMEEYLDPFPEQPADYLQTIGEKVKETNNNVDYIIASLMEILKYIAKNN